MERFFSTLSEWGKRLAVLVISDIKLVVCLLSHTISFFIFALIQNSQNKTRNMQCTSMCVSFYLKFYCVEICVFALVVSDPFMVPWYQPKQDEDYVNVLNVLMLNIKIQPQEHIILHWLHSLLRQCLRFPTLSHLASLILIFAPFQKT